MSLVRTPTLSSASSSDVSTCETVAGGVKERGSSRSGAKGCVGRSGPEAATARDAGPLVARECEAFRRVEGMKETSETDLEKEGASSQIPRPARDSFSAEGRDRSRRPWSKSSSRKDILRR
jgi:hypothetical protein